MPLLRLPGISVKINVFSCQFQYDEMYQSNVVLCWKMTNRNNSYFCMLNIKENSLNETLALSEIFVAMVTVNIYVHVLFRFCLTRNITCSFLKLF